MTSTEIAELTGKRHDNVMEDIRKMLNDLGKAAPDFSGAAEYTVNNATRTREIFNLPKRECLILISGYSVVLRAKIIDRWQELEAQQAKPISSMRMIAEMAMALDAQEQALARQQQAQQALQSQMSTVVDTIAELDSRIQSAANMEVNPKVGYASLKTLEGYVAGRFPKTLLRPLIQEHIASIHYLTCRKWIEGTAEYTEYHAFNIMDVIIVVDKVIRTGVRVMKSNNTPSTKVLSPLFSQAFKHPM